MEWTGLLANMLGGVTMTILLVLRVFLLGALGVLGDSIYALPELLFRESPMMSLFLGSVMWASLFGRMAMRLLLPMVNGCRLMRCGCNRLLMSAGIADSRMIGRVT